MSFNTLTSDNLTARIFTILTVAVVWVALFNFNGWALGYFSHSQHISYIFLPSGIRLVAVLLCGIDGVLGLFVGALFSNFSANYDVSMVLAFSLISSINPYVSIAIAKYFLRLNSLLIGINPKSVLTLSFFAALSNCITHNIYFWFKQLEGQNFIQSAAQMFIGDFFGALIVLYIMGFGIKGIRRFVG